MSQTEESLEQNYFHRPDAVPGFPFSALTLLVGRQEGKKNVGCWFVGGDDFDWSFAHLLAPVVITTLSSNKIQRGDILVPDNPADKRYIIGQVIAFIV